MLKLLIVEDEPHVREELEKLILDFFDTSLIIVDKAASVKEGIKSILKHKPDLVLLDIDLGDGSSFDILSVLPSIDFDIIFVTGYDTHAIKAIKLGALDYLLKPIDEDELKEAIEKVITNHKKSLEKEKSIDISRNYYTSNIHNKVVLKTMDTQYLIDFEDIIYCKSEGNYTTIYLLNEQIVVSKSLKKIQPLLNNQQFIKCHQSYIVNSKYVTKYLKSGFLVTKTNISIPVATRRKDEVLQMLFN